MALILKDRVKENSSSSGTGNITLGGAFPGYQTFNAVVATGSTVYYTIHNLTAGFDTEWEVGVGTFTSPATLARNTVLSSSNSGSAVNFTAGAAGLEVFITQPAGEAVYINQATNKVEAFGNGANTISFTNVTADLFTGNASAISAINASNISSGTIANARTTAASANGASTIVARDASGNFTVNAVTTTSISGNGISLTAINASNISSGTLANARTTAASANGASTIVARDANGGFTANTITLTNGTLTANAANATDITNKTYVDGLFSTGITYHAPVRVESPSTAGNLNATYNNGTAGVGATLTNAGTQAALVIDGITMVVADRVLIYNQTNQVQNGVYTVTNVGSISTNWVLTRATDANTFGLANPNTLGQGDAFFVTSGNTGAGEIYICNTVGTITFGTTNITFAQISTAQVYAAGTGLNLANLTFSIANTAVVSGLYGDSATVPVIEVNPQGQLISAANSAINVSSITVGTLPNARTTAASANGASTIVARDADGSFTANVITATAGNLTNLVATSFGVGTAASGTTGEIRATNNVTAYYSSDERLKDNVQVIANALAKVLQIRGVEFDWNNLNEPEDGYFVRKHDVGVIAQEIEKVLPEVVANREDGIKAVKYDRITPLLIEAIKELKAEVDALKGK
jgi:hypothetical protein